MKIKILEKSKKSTNPLHCEGITINVHTSNIYKGQNCRCSFLWGFAPCIARLRLNLREKSGKVFLNMSSYISVYIFVIDIVIKIFEQKSLI